jgi:lysophospholipase L1-like esterase
MKRFFRAKRASRWRQRSFEFVERSRRRDRWFKTGIVLAFCVAVAIVLGAVPRGRYVVASARALARDTVRKTLGLATPRTEIDEAWRRFRNQGIADSKSALTPIYGGAGPDMQRLMRYAGMSPDHHLLRWGNYDRTLLLPARVFEADDRGRSYRLRPCTDAIWLREVTIRSGVLMFFLVPDGPGLAAAIKGTAAIPVTTSQQSTNSWGLRGPEPDLQSPLRVLVLGDSFMQGLFIGDDDTPPECLRRELEERLDTRVSVLNTGHLGYSPEQYYYSLVEFADRFRPHVVVISTFANDFGDIAEVVISGKGDWEEAKYWIEKITQFCRSRGWPYLIVPVPYEPHVLGRRKVGYYPGLLSNVLKENALAFLDPGDDLLNAHLELVVAGDRAGKRPSGCPLFNGQIGDGHFSALGSVAWAKTVARRLALLLETNPSVTREKD